MATSVGSLVVDLKGEIASFRSSMEKADSALRTSAARMNRHLAELSAGFRMVRAAAGVFGVSLGIVELARYGRQALQAAGAIGEVAEQLGVSTDALQVYQFAAAQSGVESAQLEAGVAKLTQRIGEAAAGSGEAIAAFRDLGVGILDASGRVRSTDDVMADVADAIAGIEDPGRRAAVAVGLFGKSGQRLLPMLSGGRAGLESFAAQARGVNAVLSHEMVVASDRASDAIDRVASAWGAYFKLMAANAAPTAERVALSLLPPSALSDAELKRQILADEAFLRDRERSTKTLPTLRRLEEMRGVLAQREANIWAAGGGDYGALVRPPTTNPMPADEIARINREYEAIGKVVEALTAEREALQLSGLELAQYQALKKAGISDRHEMVARVKEEAAETYAAAQAHAREADSIARLAKAFQDGEDATEASLQAARRLKLERAETVAELQREVAGNDQLIAALHEGGDAYERMRAELEILNKLKAETGSLTAEEIAKAKELAGTIGTQKAEMDRLKDANEDAARAQRDLYHAIGTAAEDAIIRAKSLKDVLRGLLEDIQRILLRQFVTKPLEGLFTGGGSGGGGIFGDIFGGIFGGGAGGSAGGGMLPGEFPGMGDLGWFAAGTSSAPPGLAVVGEQGPELVAFGGGERVFDASETAGMLGGVQNHFHVDMRGASVEAVNELRKLVFRVNGSIEQRAVAAVANARSRGQFEP